MYPEKFFSIGVLCFLLGSVVSLLPLQKIKTYSFILSAAGALNFAVFGLLLSFGLHFGLSPLPISSVFELLFSGDGISGFFVIVISLVALPVSLFSMGYTREMNHSGLMGFFFNGFILSMYAVVTSGNIITFLLSWETMSVVSYFLVTLDRGEESSKAGLVYAVMTHIGTAFIIAAFLILYRYTG